MIRVSILIGIQNSAYRFTYLYKTLHVKFEGFMFFILCFSVIVLEEPIGNLTLLRLISHHNK